MASMTGPRRTVDLEKEPEAKLKKGLVYLFQGKAWEFDPVGCALCAKPEDSQSATMKHVDANGNDEYICQRHGRLEEIDHKVTATFVFETAGERRVVTAVRESSFLLPRSMPDDQRADIVKFIMDNSEVDERKSFGQNLGDEE